MWSLTCTNRCGEIIFYAENFKSPKEAHKKARQLKAESIRFQLARFSIEDARGYEMRLAV